MNTPPSPTLFDRPNGEEMGSSPCPPGLASLDTEALRRKLAGLADPSTSSGAISPPAIKEMAIRFISVLAHLFGNDLDRVTLWDRIGSALKTADAKTSGDDTDAFINLCLEHVLAEDGKVAACEPLGAILETLNVARAEDRSAFLAYMRTHRLPAIRFGRSRWERVKAKEIDL